MALFFVVLVFLPVRAEAQVVFNEVTPLDFGKWIILGNSSSYNVVVNTNNSYSNSPQIIMLETPEAGVYDITGLPPNTVLSVTATMVTPLTLGGSELELDNFSIVAPDSNGAGETTILLGGRARTSGSGTGLTAGSYTGEVEIEINY